MSVWAQCALKPLYTLKPPDFEAVVLCMVERQFLATGADLSREIYNEDEIYDEDALFTDPLSTPSRCQSPSRAPKLFFKEKSDVRLVGAQSRYAPCMCHGPTV